jgi:hypothetical protein
LRNGGGRQEAVDVGQPKIHRRKQHEETNGNGNLANSVARVNFGESGGNGLHKKIRVLGDDGARKLSGGEHVLHKIGGEGGVKGA